MSLMSKISPGPEVEPRMETQEQHLSHKLFKFRLADIADSRNSARMLIDKMYFMERLFHHQKNSGRTQPDYTDGHRRSYSYRNSFLEN